MSTFEKTRYIFDQSIWECNGHFDHWFSHIKSFLCGAWNLCKEKLYPEDFSMNTAQLRRETRGQWQKCYGEVSMSIHYYQCIHVHAVIVHLSFLVLGCCSTEIVNG